MKHQQPTDAIRELAALYVRKRLWLDTAQQRLTALVRMTAGTRFPSHRHADTGELYTLEDDLTVAGQGLQGRI